MHSPWDPQDCCSTMRANASRQTLTNASERHMVKTDRKYLQSFLTMSLMYSNQRHCTSTPSLAASACQSLPVFFCKCVCPNNFTMHTKTQFFLSDVKCLQKHYIKESLLTVLRLCFLLSLLASYLMLCDGEGASISEDPPHPYQWLPFIWCHWKCMHFLLGMKKSQRWETGIGESIELK